MLQFLACPRSMVGEISEDHSPHGSSTVRLALSVHLGSDKGPVEQ